MDSIVCQKFCKSYKPENTGRPKCGSYEFLRSNLTMRELRLAAETTPVKADLSRDDAISQMVCTECALVENLCKYRNGSDKTPCGGYSIVSHLLKESTPIS